ncbi:MAG: hypothetical protein FJX64_09890, partial [Alphaproteobacteria bacterium]|nr:hypothetical protein [Alphaproteobacteria bacterium]
MMHHTPLPAPRGGLLPAGLRQFFRHRAFEAMGVSLATLSVLLAIALVTYYSADPSWNNSTTAGPRNMIGMPGAFASDLLLQTLGLGAALVPLLLLAWAWRLFVHQGMPRFWLKLTLAPFSLLFAAAVAASFPPFPAWPVQSGLGGVLGDALHNLAQRSGHSLLPMVPPAVWDGVVALFALIALVLSLGLSTREWAGMGGGAVGAARSSAAGVGRGLLGLEGMVRRVPLPQRTPGPLLRPAPRVTRDS